MDTSSFVKLGKLFSTEYSGNDIDFIDRLNYQYSSGILMVFITLIGFRQIVGAPIQCWVPQEFTRSWEQYAENLCWVQNTYRSPTFSSASKFLSANSKVSYPPKLSKRLMVPKLLRAKTMLIDNLVKDSLHKLKHQSLRQPFMTRFSRNSDLFNPNNVHNNEDNSHDLNAAKTNPSSYIRYYQWVAIVLAAQALLCLFPNTVWRVMNKRGLPVLLSNAKEAAPGVLYETRQLALQRILSAFHEISQATHIYNSKSGFFSRLLSYPVPPAWRITIVFFTVRCFTITNDIGQLYLMKYFIQTNETLFGIWVFRDILLTGAEWRETINFPRVTFCNINIRRFGQSNPVSHTFQCVLPINHFIEKVYVFLWIWFVCLTVLTTINTLQWCALILFPWCRVRFIRQYLRAFRLAVANRTNGSSATTDDLFSGSGGGDWTECGKFIRDVLGADGILILMAVSKAASDLVALDVTASLWTNYQRARLTGQSAMQSVSIPAGCWKVMVHSKTMTSAVGGSAITVESASTCTSNVNHV